MSAYYIGLMSGTSLDGVDAVLADFSATTVKIIHSVFSDFPAPLRQELFKLQTPDGINELARSMQAANRLADLYAQVVADLLQQAQIAKHAVVAIGAHGQTVRHQPTQGYSIQLNAPARLAELTGINVIADFRSRDIAAGGQGAPLVPAFHAAILQDQQRFRAVLNLGGMSNLSILPALESGAAVFGFDCGPGNVLLDAWIQAHTGKAFDQDGAWAATGVVHPSLLEELLKEAFFAQAPPKSTGRELFNLDWLTARITRIGGSAMRAEDVQATLLVLTVEVIARALERYAPDCCEVYVCGGGARNLALMRAFKERLPSIDWRLSDAIGIPLQGMEALAFAWLAWRHTLGLPGNLPAVTGARGARILGACYPA